MNILIIGGTRFIGPHVVRRLLGEGHWVTLFHRGQTETERREGLRCIHGDRKDLVQFQSEFERLAPDLVLDMMLTTEQQALDLLQVFRGLARRVIALSSSDVYRPYELLLGRAKAAPSNVPAREDSPLRKHLYPARTTEQSPEDRHYNYEKILVERVLMSEAGQLPATVLRLPAVYGPGDYQHRLFPYLKRMDDTRPVILLEEGYDEWRWTRGYVENVADAIALAVNREEAANRIYNVGESEALSEKEWVREIGRAAGWTGEIVVLPTERLPQKMRSSLAFQHHLVTDTRRIREELDYTERVERGEALRRTIEWERAHPPAEINAEEFDYQAEDAVLNG